MDTSQGRTFDVRWRFEVLDMKFKWKLINLNCRLLQKADFKSCIKIVCIYIRGRDLFYDKIRFYLPNVSLKYLDKNSWNFLGFVITIFRL